MVREQKNEDRQTQDSRQASLVVAETAHELRLPIANIKLLVETLLDGAIDERDVSKRMLKRIYQEVERLQALVQDLLSLEQLSERQHDLRCQWLPLKERVVYASESLSGKAKDKDVQLLVEIDDKQLIYANQGQLDQVLLNLIENAVKFTGPGGRVRIASGKNPGSFKVEDNGIGIPESELPKIFAKFYRIDKSISKGGTGLGLSIVKQVAELHGAKISVVSKEGSGSCFELDFPMPKQSSR